MASTAAAAHTTLENPFLFLQEFKSSQIFEHILWYISKQHFTSLNVSLQK